MVGGAFALVIAAQVALEGGSGVLTAVLIAGGLLSASTWVTLEPAIRRLDKRGPLTPAELSRSGRLGDRVALIMATLYCVAFPIVGYVLEGVAGAIFFFVMGALCAGLGVRAHRRLGRRSD